MNRLLVPLFCLSLLGSAALLFAMQPMIARLALPVLGGSPAVWNTCLVFFQGTVLGGYLLAHLFSRSLGNASQACGFLLLILIGAVVLPLRLSGEGADASHAWPAAWLLGQLAGHAALPALALSVTSPLLQRWFARTGHPQAADPYFLYSASNLGSLGALLLVPAVIDPALGLDEQHRGWAIGYLIWGGLIVCCAALALNRAWRPSAGSAGYQPAAGGNLPAANVQPAGEPQPSTQAEPHKAGGLVARPDGPVARATPDGPVGWLLLAAIPASLLQGCTLFLTTDIASVPLLWVIPLGVYLLTFVMAFARGGGVATRWAGRALPFLAVAMAFIILARASQPLWLLISLHLLFLFTAGLACHGRLAAGRPASEELTVFYIWLSFGGVLGGSFSALLAPKLFDSVAEYPLTIVAAAAALPLRGGIPGRPGVAGWAWDLAWVTIIGVSTLALGAIAPWVVGPATALRNALVFGLPAIAVCVLLDRPRRFALGLGTLFLAGLSLQARWSGVQHAERNFFGVTRVTRDPAGRFHQLVHGNTVHGRQFIDPSRHSEPLTYYHRAGPLGSLLAEFQKRPGPRSVGVIGLGTGSMAAYARHDEDWTFFEIDPAVIRVARDTNWFSYLADCGAKRLRIIDGDARVRLQAERDSSFDLLILDAFSSDAIPVHLMTREALGLYERKLKSDGWVAAHISNRYLGLEPVFAALARDGHLVCRSSDDMSEADHPGKEASHWLVLARSERDLGRLARSSTWLPAEGAGRVRTWTDNYASLLPVFEWR